MDVDEWMQRLVEATPDRWEGMGYVVPWQEWKNLQRLSDRALQDACINQMGRSADSDSAYNQQRLDLLFLLMDYRRLDFDRFLDV